MIIPSLNVVFCLECGLEIASSMIGQRKKKFLVAGNNEYQETAGNNEYQETAENNEYQETIGNN